MIFNPKGYIESLVYQGKEYVGDVIPIFALSLRDKDGKQRLLDAFSMKLTAADGNRYTYACPDATVTCSFDEELNWHIEVTGVRDVVEWVDFPQICVPYDLADRGGHSKILWGFNEGSLIENLTDREDAFPYLDPVYPSQGVMGMFPAIVETQFMAYYDDRSGLYFGAHDRDYNLKGINFRAYGKGIKLEFRHFTGCRFGEDYRMPFPMVMRFFEGDYYDACDIYRDWFEEVPHLRISENPRLPDWYGKSPVVVTYPVRGHHDTDVMEPNKLFPYTNVLPQIERLEKAFGSKILVLLMHWEGTAPWAPPIVWPPYGGEAALGELIDALHRRGDVLGVYCSGLGWTVKSNLVDYETQKRIAGEHLETEMCRSPEGTLPYSKICTGQRVGYDLCPTREFTSRVVRSQVDAMVGAGIDYIQLMDQNHGGTSYFCYSRDHGHPPVPGRWQVDAVRKLLDDVNARSGKVLFGCESAAAESYIPNLLFSDNRFELCYGIGQPVPVYAYLFHPYLNNFMGNQVIADYFVDYTRSPEGFWEHIAHAFIVGDMLTAVITDEGMIDWNWGKLDKSRPLPDQEKTETLIRNLNAWRQREGRYLHTGRMIKPLPVECGTRTFYRPNGSSYQLPEILTSAWVAEDGTRAQFFVNYTDAEAVCTVQARGIVRSLDGETETDGKIVLPPLSAVMMVLK